MILVSFVEEIKATPVSQYDLESFLFLDERVNVPFKVASLSECLVF